MDKTAWTGELRHVRSKLGISGRRELTMISQKTALPPLRCIPWLVGLFVAANERELPLSTYRSLALMSSHRKFALVPIGTTSKALLRFVGTQRRLATWTKRF